MISSAFFCYLTLISLFGYSYFYERFIVDKNVSTISNKNIFSGLLVVIFLSLLLNFFFPLKFFSIIILFGGLIFFVVGYKKKIYRIRFLFFFLFFLILNFITYYNGINVDSPMYHLQTLNWMILSKVNFGITNLNIRFGQNSSWHSFLALTDIKNNFVNLKFFLSSIIFSIAIYSSLFKKKYFISDVFLFLSISYLLFFSFLHPFVNGPILNQLGNPEVDTVAMFLYFLSVYYFLKLFENNSEGNSKDINYLVILIFLAISVKISNASLFFLLLYIVISHKNYRIFNFSNLFVVITSFLWLLKSFVLSGCLIFPINQTCIQTSWTNIAETDLHNKIIQSFSRDTRLRENYMDFDYTLKSNDWIKPWFEDYFMNTAILQISMFLIILSLSVIFLSLVLEKLKIKNSINLNKFPFTVIILFFVISIYVWFKAPEVRFGSGLIISLPCILIAISLYKFNLIKYLNYKNTIFCIFTLLIMLVFKHYQKFEIDHLVLNNRNEKNYENINKIFENNEIEIFHSPNWRCGEFPKICVNNKRDNYEIAKKLNYRIFLKEEN